MSSLKDCFCSIPFSSNNEIAQNQEIVQILKEFDTHLKTMKAELFRMCCHGAHYDSAVDAAHTLIKKLEEARIVYINLNTQESTQEFLKSCQKAIDDAHPVLSTQRNWVGFFSKLLSVLTIIGGLVLIISNRRIDFWKTQAEQNLDELKQNISKTLGG